MAEHRAVFLSQPAAIARPGHGVGFGQIEGDQAVVVACHDRRLMRQRLREFGLRILVGQEIETQSVFGIVEPAAHRQAQPHQGIERVALGLLQRVPVLQILGHGQVRDRLVQTAGRAQRSVVAGRQKPVADPVLDLIGASTVHARRIIGGMQACIVWLERGHLQAVGQKADRASARRAQGVLKEQCISTHAMSDFHGRTRLQHRAALDRNGAH